MKLIHHSPLGPLIIPGVLGSVEPGQKFDVDDIIGASLLQQSDIYQLGPVTSIKELRALAAAAHIDTTGLDRNDIIAALAAAGNGEDQA